MSRIESNFTVILMLYPPFEFPGQEIVNLRKIVDKF